MFDYDSFSHCHLTDIFRYFRGSKRVKLFLLSQNIIVLLSLGLFAKELSSTIIEFLCIALLEVEINKVKDC